jgi:hypothetical protein
VRRGSTAHAQHEPSTAQEKKLNSKRKILTQQKIGHKNWISLLTISILIINNVQYAGVYDEMRDLEAGVTENEARELLGPPTETEKETLSKEEEEALLAYSDGDGAGADQGDDEMKSDEEEEKRREREADLTDLLQMNRKREERMLRRKLEREKQKAELALKEAALREAERERIRSEVAAEKQIQIEKLERELRLARKESEGPSGSGKGEKRKLEGQQRERTNSQESRNESIASSAVGANILNLPAGYRAIRSSKISSLAVRHLNGGAAIPFKPIGAFANDSDARIRLAHTISDATSLRNIRSSFNIENFVCNTCTVRGEHQVLGKKSEGADGTRQSPPCFVLSDQNFPSVIPVEGDGDCFKILQVENASLSDLTTVFLAALEGFTVPARTVVLISSVSHLAEVGTAAYAEDLVRAFRAIRAVYESGITVMHGIPLLLSGIDSQCTIRSLLEIGAWYQGVSALSTKELIQLTHNDVG